MKRLVWLILIAFGTALAQVQPVDVALTKQAVCDCCDQPGACGMPECGLPPGHAPVTLTAERPAGELRRQTGRTVAKLSGPAFKFYLSLMEPAKVGSALRAPFDPAPAASVPLFQEHCSLLI